MQPDGDAQRRINPEQARGQPAASVIWTMVVERNGDVVRRVLLVLSDE
jgi:hypothetical protein